MSSLNSICGLLARKLVLVGDAVAIFVSGSRMARGTEASSQEAAVTVNGVTLTFSQVMSVRAAVTSMLWDLSYAQHVKDLGEIGPMYQRSLREVEALLVANGRRA